VSQEESEQNEVDGMKKGVDSTGEVMHMTYSCIDTIDDETFRINYTLVDLTVSGERSTHSEPVER